MANDQQFCLRWNNHQSTLVSVFDNLLESQTLVDCTLAADGQYLKAHKVVLSACSPYLEAILCQNLDKHPILILKDVKFTELKAMLDYMYRGEVNISQEQLTNFLKAAESLQIKGLTDSGGGGGGDLRDKRPDLRKPLTQPVPHIPQPRPVVPHGLLDQRRSLPHFPLHIADMQPQSPQVAREGSTSPTARKRRRPNRPSSDDSNFVSTPNSLSENQPDTSDSCDLPVKPTTNSVTSNVPNSTKAPETDTTPQPTPQQNSEQMKQVSVKKEFNESLLTPKTELDYGNDNSMEDVTYEDEDEDDVDLSKPGPSFSANSQGFPPWVGGDGSNDDSNNIYSPDVSGTPNNQNNSQDELFTFASCGALEETDPFCDVEDSIIHLKPKPLFSEEGIPSEDFKKILPLQTNQSFKTISSEVYYRKKHRFPIWSPSKSLPLALDNGKSAKHISTLVSKQLVSQTKPSGAKNRGRGRPRKYLPGVKRGRGRPRKSFPTGVNMKNNDKSLKLSNILIAAQPPSDLPKSKVVKRSCSSLPPGFYREDTLQFINEQCSLESSLRNDEESRNLGNLRDKLLRIKNEPLRIRNVRTLRSDWKITESESVQSCESDQENTDTNFSNRLNETSQIVNPCYIKLEKLDDGFKKVPANASSINQVNYGLKDLKVELEDISAKNPCSSKESAESRNKNKELKYKLRSGWTEQRTSSAAEMIKSLMMQAKTELEVPLKSLRRSFRK